MYKIITYKMYNQKIKENIMRFVFHASANDFCDKKTRYNLSIRIRTNRSFTHLLIDFIFKP